MRGPGAVGIGQAIEAGAAEVPCRDDSNPGGEHARTFARAHTSAHARTQASAAAMEEELQKATFP